MGFTTAQNTSVCDVYGREGMDREVTSEPECSALFLATSPTLFLAQLLKVSLSFLPSSFLPSPSPSLPFSFSLPLSAVRQSLPPSLFPSLPSSQSTVPAEEPGFEPGRRSPAPGRSSLPKPEAARTLPGPREPGPPLTGRLPLWGLGGFQRPPRPISRSWCCPTYFT